MCFVCDRIKETRVGNNPFFVKELETGYVVIGDYQHFKGILCFYIRPMLLNYLILMQK